MAKAPTLKSVLSELRAEDKSIGYLSEFDMSPQGYSTGNITLDYLTGVGGFPKGRIIELYGRPSSGKSTSALQAIAQAQAQGGTCAFFDYEHTLDAGYCAALGVDTKALIYMQPTSFEHGANKFRKLLTADDGLSISVFDSVAEMITENEIQSETGAAKVADRAKMMHQFLRQIVGTLHRTGCTAIFLNHVLDSVDTSPWGQKMAARGIKTTYTPGGQALPFYSSLRVEFRQVGNEKTKEDNVLTGQKEDLVTQTNVRAVVTKNKVGDPFGSAVLRVRWGRGFSQPYSIFSILKANGLITLSGAKYSFPSDLAFTAEQKAAFPVANSQRGDGWIAGEDNVLKAIECTPAWMAVLEKAAATVLAEKGVEKVDPALYAPSADLDESIDFTVDTATGEIL